MFFIFHPLNEIEMTEKMEKPLEIASHKNNCKNTMQLFNFVPSNYQKR